MLIVQTYNSIHDIDPEFINSIELLLKEEVPSFEVLRRWQDDAPPGENFTYFLFFGPTQNTPVGFSQVVLRKVPWEPYIPWWRRLLFWQKTHLSWAQADWRVAGGSAGTCVFDPRFVRNGKEKVQQLIHQYEERRDIMASLTYCVKGLQEAPTAFETKATQEIHVLEPLPRSSRTYQDYLSTLTAEAQKHIKESWRALHKSGEVFLGDYATAGEIPEGPLKKMKADQVLTFERDKKVLGAVTVQKGKDGNIFFEPQPFEPQPGAVVSDELYIQYALLKFFELPEARRCHILKDGQKMIFERKSDLSLFLDQGFGSKTVLRAFSSRLKGMDAPV